MSHKDCVVKQQVYVVPGLATPLLGLPAIQNLCLLSPVDAIATDNTYVRQYPRVFTGLGKLEGEYRIKLKDNATPFALVVPRHLPLRLRGKVQEELNRMEAMGVISPIEEATEWCSGMVGISPTHHLHHTIQPFLFRLPFGISSAPEHFQKRLTQMLDGLEGTVCHADDILVFGATQQEYDERLHRVLQRLQQRGLTLNDKCQFAVTEVKFLGHIVSGKGIRPDPDKIRAIAAMSPPRDVEDVKRFMGMLQVQGQWRPVALISHSMTKTERRYAQIEKEALAITWACERFQTYLLGLHFEIRTDHKPLLSLLSSRALDDIPPRALRFRLRLLRFTYTIVHVPGKNLIAADALLRAPLQGATTEEDLVLQSDARGASVLQNCN
ncbi:hypothetical protein ACEWY4_016125 [Coilia grayii]|uniref:ribonuclease H n=1 Tax=Coilia grayii TaxID=363190 RepID=A0ABD1JQU0_9TELE